MQTAGNDKVPMQEPESRFGSLASDWERAGVTRASCRAQGLCVAFNIPIVSRLVSSGLVARAREMGIHPQFS